MPALTEKTGMRRSRIRSVRQRDDSVRPYSARQD
nr:MAG TPA: hypothetical protein [Caudoviricetes sp.]